MEILYTYFLDQCSYLADNQWIAVALAGLISGVIAISAISIIGLVATWSERKVAAHMQSRFGPMRTGGWHGWAQSIADGVKLLLKEDIIPHDVDRVLFIMAPYLVMIGTLTAFVVIPFSKHIMVSDLDIGLFYLLSVSSLGVIGILMAGWGSNNKWSLLGGMRSASQVISYEIPLGLALIVGILPSGTLSMKSIIENQAGGFWHWNVFNIFGLAAFLVYYIASLAETNRTPFDIPEAESELVAGYHTEYSGIRFSFFFIAEYANMFIVSAIATTVFLGGWDAGLPFLNFIPGVIIFIVKCSFLVFVMMWLRWTLPRLRVDQLTGVCWKYLTPISFFLIICQSLYMLIVSGAQ